MAEITYQVIQKPIEQRIIDAACIYWDVERTYFGLSEDVNVGTAKGRIDETISYRRSIICYLIKTITNMPDTGIAALMGRASRSGVIRSIESIDARKDVQKSIHHDINQISHLANIIDAQFISTSIKLINNKIQKS